MFSRPKRRLAGIVLAGMVLAGCAADDSTPTTEGDLPEISGEYGQAPDFTWPATDPPAELDVEVLSEGEGPEVAVGATVIADYEGRVWGADEPFDSSYAQGAPAEFPLPRVVQGWQEAIPGHAAGSRLLVSIPPDLGYGPEGNPGAGIGGEDTIVFVIDIVASFAADSMGEADAAPVELPEEVPVTVEGDLGSQFTITIDDDAAEPQSPEAFALSQGSGPLVVAGDQVIVAFALTSWDNEVTESSWMPELGDLAGPVTMTIGAGSGLDLLEGFEVGSRVLLTQIATAEMPAVVIVADIIGAF